MIKDLNQILTFIPVTDTEHLADWLSDGYGYDCVFLKDGIVVETRQLTEWKNTVDCFNRSIDT